MRVFAPLLFTAIAGLAACAQTPESQLSRSPTVRLCNGNACAEQDRRVATFTPAGPTESDRRMQALAEKAEGNPNAAYDLGLRLLRGDGVERNTYQALEWMRKAGDNGHVQAQLALGRLYLMGFEEMGADPAEAEAWLIRAASKGNKEAAALIPQAQAAKKDEHALYRVREAYRTSWYAWYSGYPYYWVWGPSGWYQR